MGCAVAQLVAAQHGVVARWQLDKIGLGRGAIEHWLRIGRLHRVHRGVYSLAPPSLLSLEGRWMAAVLACGKRALLSHRDGARLHGVWRSSRRQIDITCARSRGAIEGITPHRPRSLDDCDRVRRDNIPVTSLARTYLDCASVLPQRHVVNALEEGERLRILDLKEIQATIGRSPGHPGRAPLLAGLGATLEEAQHTKLDLERLLLEICVEASIPLPATNTMVEGYEVDAHWPGTKVIVELDSWEFHRTRAAFERDRARDLHLELKHYRVLRLTWRQLTERREEVIRTLRALLGSC